MRSKHRTDLRRSNTDLRSSVNVDTTVGLTRNGRADSVHDTNTKSAPLQAVAQRENRVGSLTTLTHKHTHVIPEDRRLPIEEVRRKFNGDRDLGEFFEDGAGGDGGVITRTASTKDNSPATTDDRQVRAETTQSDDVLVKVDTTTHGVDDRLGLLVDLLLHEVVELALHDLGKLDLEGFDGTRRRDLGAVRAAQTVDVEFTLGNVGDVVVLEVQDTLGVLDDGGSIGGDEEFDGKRHAIL